MASSLDCCCSVGGWYEGLVSSFVRFLPLFTLGDEHSALGVEHSALGVEHSAVGDSSCVG